MGEEGTERLGFFSNSSKAVEITPLLVTISLSDKFSLGAFNKGVFVEASWILSAGRLTFKPEGNLKEGFEIWWSMRTFDKGWYLEAVWFFPEGDNCPGTRVSLAFLSLTRLVEQSEQTFALLVDLNFLSQSEHLIFVFQRMLAWATDAMMNRKMKSNEIYQWETRGEDVRQVENAGELKKIGKFLRKTPTRRCHLKNAKNNRKSLIRNSELTK